MTSSACALSVPMMINAQSPTMITVDMAFRINSYGDYGVANALGFISYPVIKLLTGKGRTVHWILYVLAGLLVAYFVGVRGRMG